MKNKIVELRNDLKRQLNSYQQLPAKNDYDKGYKAGVYYAYARLLKLYPQFAVKPQTQASKKEVS